MQSSPSLELGSTSLTTDASGAKVSEIRYKAWGEIRATWTASPSTGNLASKAGVSYAYDANHPHAVASLSNSNSYQQDANGNQVVRVIDRGPQAGTYNLSYDAENRLVEVSGPSAFSAAFVYDGDGKQVKATINGVTVYYIGNHYEVKSGVVSNITLLVQPVSRSARTGR